MADPDILRNAHQFLLVWTVTRQRYHASVGSDDKGANWRALDVVNVRLFLDNKDIFAKHTPLGQKVLETLIAESSPSERRTMFRKRLKANRRRR